MKFFGWWFLVWFYFGWFDSNWFVLFDWIFVYYWSCCFGGDYIVDDDLFVVVGVVIECSDLLFVDVFLIYFVLWLRRYSKWSYWGCNLVLSFGFDIDCWKLEGIGLMVIVVELKIEVILNICFDLEFDFGDVGKI